MSDLEAQEVTQTGVVLGMLSASLTPTPKADAPQGEANKEEDGNDEGFRLVRGWLGERLSGGVVARCGAGILQTVAG